MEHSPAGLFENIGFRTRSLAFWGKKRMLNGQNGQRIACVLIDLNTQRDFFESNGACPVADAREYFPKLRRIVAWARRNHVPIVSSMDSHRAWERPDHGGRKHCVDGTNGQLKLGFTLFPNRVFVDGDNTIAVPVDLFKRHQQVIFPQRTNDLFTNPKADRFMTQLTAEEFILFGAVTEREIKAAALGLMARHRRVTVLVDACGGWNSSESDLSLRQISAKGAILSNVDELLTRRLSRSWRYTQDDLVRSCRGNGICRSTNGKAHGNGRANGGSRANGNGTSGANGRAIPKNGHNELPGSNGFGIQH